VFRQGGRARVVDTGVGRLERIRGNGDGGVRLEMENADIVIIIIVTTNTIEDRKMATTEMIMRMTRMFLDQNTLTVVIHDMTTNDKQKTLAEIQYQPDHEDINHNDNTAQKAISED
jgi:hypothetical protein